jgi:CheY-like chemotaxis protein
MSGKRILVVDDDPVVLGMVGTLLRQKGYEPTLCDNGPQAIQEALNSPPDLIVLDLGLPSPDPNKVVNFDGFKVLNWLSRIHKRNRIPVVVFTGHTADSEKAQAIEAGAVAVITKGSSPHKLFLAIQIALDEV